MNAPGQKKDPLIKREESLLVMIDMQERLVPAVAEKEKVVENALRLARFSKIVGLPVIVTEQQKLGKTLPEIIEALHNPSVVGKLDFNCFGEDAFIDRVRTLRPVNIVLAGIEAHICVAQTALSALSEHRVYVVADAISSRTHQNREIAIRRMEAEGVAITSTEMLIYELLQRAGTDEFREVLKLVK